MSVELDAEAEDQDPEEGDRVDLALATDEPGLSGELFDLLGEMEADEGLLDLPGLERGGTNWGRGLSRHPIEVAAAR